MIHNSKRLTGVIAVFLVITIISAAAFAVPVSAASDNTLQTITSLNMRSSASTTASVIKVLPANTSLTLLKDTESGWAYVSDGSNKGYVSCDYIQPNSNSGIKMTATTNDDVNIRSGKGTTYSSVTVVPKNKSMTVTDNSDDDWAAVKYSTYTGYAKKEFLVINMTMATTTPTTAPTQAPTTAAPTQAPTAASPEGHRSASFENLPNMTKGSSSTVKKLILPVSSVTLDINGTYTLTVMDASSKKITAGLSFSSSNTAVASVTSSGVIRGVKTGSAKITVKSASGGYATCNVSVGTKVLPTTAPATQAPTQKPTQAPTQKPTQAPTQKPTTAVAETLTLSATSAKVYNGNYYQLIATSNVTVTFTSSNTSVATVNAKGIVTAKAVGTATITAKTSTKSATCKITVISGSSVSITQTTATITAGKTLLTRSYTSGVTWKSSNTAVATVSNGYILAKKSGYAVISASTSSGAATCLVTVKAPAPIKFAYTSPNCAAKGQTVSLIAITDNKRTGVRFTVTIGDTTKYIEATSVKDGSTLVWTGKTSFSTAGTFKVVASSCYNGTWSTCADGETTAFIANSTDRDTSVCTQRRPSDEVINLIATFEGYASTVYEDPLTTVSTPTIGYGIVVYSGDQFYNTLTKKEAYAWLVQSINNDGYAAKVNSFLTGNNVKFNQQHFDALVCFVYNVGTGILTSDSDIKNALLNCPDGTGSGSKTVYYINGAYVRLRKGPGTNYDIITEMDSGTVITIVDKSNASWYKVKLSDGTTGYVMSDYVSSRKTGGNLDLKYVNRQALIDSICQYHHAGGHCYYGLLYRRVDEVEIFLYGEYVPCYGNYKYNISFKCKNDPSFHT